MGFASFSRASAPVGSVTFSVNPSIGSHGSTIKLQPKDYSNGNVLYCYTKGLTDNQFSLSWKFMTAADYANLKTFFDTVVDGAAYDFTYTDRDGNTYTCRFLTDKLDWITVGTGYTGSLLLREE